MEVTRTSIRFKKSEGFGTDHTWRFTTRNTDELDNLAKYCDLWFIHGNHDSKTTAAFESLWGVGMENSQFTQPRSENSRQAHCQGLAAFFEDRI